jgi:uncharacterized protein (TIGR02147 family)
MINIPNICEYTDYRKFLKDYYEAVKAKNPGFSYQVFSQKAGIRSKGFLYNIFTGARNLSKANILGLAEAMKLGKYEADYFESLVAFNQAAGLKERNHFYAKLSAIKATGKNAWRPQIVRKEQFEFYSKLYHSVIRSIIDLRGFKEDYKTLAKLVSPRITPGQAKKCVALLQRLGFIKRQADGTFKVADKAIATPPEVANLAVTNFHQEAGTLALKALHNLSGDQRNITGMTLGISKEIYKEICVDIQQFRTKILQKAEADQNADKVYQLNFQFFPVSETVIERKFK